MRVPIRRVAGYLAAFLLVGCQYDPYASQYTTKKPDPRSLLGTWVLDLDRLPDRFQAQRQALARSALTLRPDQSFSFESIPDAWNSDDRKVKGLMESGTGTWKHDNAMQDRWDLRLELRELRGSPALEDRLLHITGANPPYGLQAGIGDPDSGEALIFVRPRS